MSAEISQAKEGFFHAKIPSATFVLHEYCNLSPALIDNGI